MRVAPGAIAMAKAWGLNSTGREVDSTHSSVRGVRMEEIAYYLPRDRYSVALGSTASRRCAPLLQDAASSRFTLVAGGKFFWGEAYHPYD